MLGCTDDRSFECVGARAGGGARRCDVYRAEDVAVGRERVRVASRGVDARTSARERVRVTARGPGRGRLGARARSWGQVSGERPGSDSARSGDARVLARRWMLAAQLGQTSPPPPDLGCFRQRTRPSAIAERRPRPDPRGASGSALARRSAIGGARGFVIDREHLAAPCARRTLTVCHSGHALRDMSLSGRRGRHDSGASFDAHGASFRPGAPAHGRASASRPAREQCTSRPDMVGMSTPTVSVHAQPRFSQARHARRYQRTPGGAPRLVDRHGG